MATFKGIISQALPEQSGVSRNGNNWRSEERRVGKECRV